MYEDLFLSSGLNDNEAVVYEFLLKTGKATAGEIIKNTPVKRGVAYNTLADLVAKKLVSETKIKTKGARGKNVIAEFSPNHPENLRSYLENEKEKLEKAEKNLEANISSLISDFSLVSGRPGVRYFEGMEGIRKVLEDSLTSKNIIYTYADIEAICKYIDETNQSYVKKRDDMGIKKMAVIIDSPFAKKYLKDYYKAVTDVRFIDHELFPFNCVMQIYEGKVSYITLSDVSMVGVIIQDENIYQMHKSVFEFVWSHAEIVS